MGASAARTTGSSGAAARSAASCAANGAPLSTAAASANVPRASACAARAAARSSPPAASARSSAPTRRRTCGAAKRALCLPEPLSLADASSTSIIAQVISVCHGLHGAPARQGGCAVGSGCAQSAHESAHESARPRRQAPADRRRAEGSGAVAPSHAFLTAALALRGVRAGAGLRASSMARMRCRRSAASASAARACSSRACAASALASCASYTAASRWPTCAPGGRGHARAPRRAHAVGRGVPPGSQRLRRSWL